MGTTYKVASAAELESVLSQATGGDVIELAAGNYGELYIKNSVYSGEVRIVSEDPDNMAVFKGIQLLESGNLTFDSIHLDLDPQDGDLFNVGLRITESSDVTIENSVLHGGFVSHPDEPALDAYPVGRGVHVISSEDVVVRNNDIYDLEHGVLHNKSDGLIIDNNDIHDTRQSPIAGGGTSNITITDNNLWHVEPYGYGTATGDHADMMHFYPVYDQTGGVKNVTITGNTMLQSDSPTAVLGVYLDDYGVAGEGHGYTNVVISDNILHNGNAQGIRIENGNGVTITDNTLVQGGGDENDAPGISLIANTRNAVVDNNIISGQLRGTSIDDASGQNVTIGDNLLTQRTDPAGDNYAGDIFVNGLADVPSLEELQIIPGSEADGYGADASKLDSTPEGYTAIVSGLSGSGLSMKTVTFDAEAFFGPDGEIDPDTASIRWDFPDGTTAYGETVSHAFDVAGLHDVKVTVTPAEGAAFVVGKTVAVVDPYAIRTDFSTGTQDLSDLENPVTTLGSVTYEATDLGSSLRLGTSTSRLTFEQSPELLNNPEFTFSMAFNKDAGDASLKGTLAYFSGSGILRTDEETISFDGRTSTGDVIALEFDEADIEDGEWHEVTYTFSQEAGTATLYLDGQVVDKQTGLTGIQYTANGHDLHLGGLSKESFQGLIDNVAFIKTALDTYDSEEEFEAVESPLINALEPEFEFVQSVAEPEPETNTVTEVVPVAVSIASVTGESFSTFADAGGTASSSGWLDARALFEAISGVSDLQEHTEVTVNTEIGSFLDA